MRQAVLVGELRLSEVVDRLAPFNLREFSKATLEAQTAFWHRRNAALNEVGEALKVGDLASHVRDDKTGQEFRIPPQDWNLLHKLPDCIVTSIIDARDSEPLKRLQGLTVFVRETEVERWLAHSLTPKVSLDGAPYLSPFMSMMIAAISHYGVSSDSFPKKEELEEHFKKQRLPDGRPVSNVQAEYMATFIRPFEAMRGGNKRVG